MTDNVRAIIMMKAANLTGICWSALLTSLRALTQSDEEELCSRV